MLRSCHKNKAHFIGYKAVQLLSPTAICLQQYRSTILCTDYFLAAPGFGRLVPYLERRWLRLATPAVSSVPRTM